MNIDTFLLHRQPSLHPTQQLCGVVSAPHFPIEKVEGPCHMDVSFAHGKRVGTLWAHGSKVQWATLFSNHTNFQPM